LNRSVALWFTAETTFRLVPERLRLQSVRDAAMRRGARRVAARGQKNRRRRAERALAAVAQMLMDVYDCARRPRCRRAA